MQLTNSIDLRTSKRKLIDAEATLIESLRDQWTPFAITAVFRSSGRMPRQDRWIDEYRHKVAWKVNKRLSRRASELIVIHELACFYEFGESSMFKTLADQRRPHHVHATLLVPKKLAFRVWNETDNRIDARLEKDFSSIKTVSSVLMEPLRIDHAVDWVTYSAKGKPFYVH